MEILLQAGGGTARRIGRGSLRPGSADVMCKGGAQEAPPLHMLSFVTLLANPAGSRGRIGLRPTSLAKARRSAPVLEQEVPDDGDDEVLL